MYPVNPSSQITRLADDCGVAESARRCWVREDVLDCWRRGRSQALPPGGDGRAEWERSGSGETYLRVGARVPKEMCYRGALLREAQASPGVTGQHQAASVEYWHTRWGNIARMRDGRPPLPLVTGPAAAACAAQWPHQEALMATMALLLPPLLSTTVCLTIAPL